MKYVKRIVVCILLGVCCLQFSAVAAEKEDFDTTPTTNNGKKWRVGYYEGGEYIDYQKIFSMTVKGLMELGWIEDVEIPPQKGEQTKELWKWLSENIRSDYIEFVADAHYSSNWDDALTETMVTDIIDRLNNIQDIDLMIAGGTTAGKELGNDKHSTQTIVISSSDPIGSGIVKSVDDSGYDHLHATVDPFRYERQIRIFYEIIGFQKLGVAYENTDNGRSYAALNDIERVAEEFGFEIVSCYTQDEVPDITVAEESVKQCFQELGEKGVDAIYVTVQNGVNLRSIPELVKIVNSFRIPTFAQSSSEEVKYGFLLSISQAGFKYIGQFHAQTIAKILNGAEPRQLELLFEEPPKIAINLKTAQEIAYDPPIDVLGAVDEIYDEIPEQ